MSHSTWKFSYTPKFLYAALVVSNHPFKSSKALIPKPEKRIEKVERAGGQSVEFQERNSLGYCKKLKVI